jgi:hypothetical protein
MLERLDQEVSTKYSLLLPFIYRLLLPSITMVYHVITAVNSIRQIILLGVTGIVLIIAMANDYDFDVNAKAKTGSAKKRERAHAS